MAQGFVDYLRAVMGWWTKSTAPPTTITYTFSFNVYANASRTENVYAASRLYEDVYL